MNPNPLVTIHSQLKNIFKHPDKISALCKSWEYEIDQYVKSTDISENDKKLLSSIKIHMGRILKKQGNVSDICLQIIQMIEHHLKNSHKLVSTVPFGIKEDTSLIHIVESIVHPADPMRLVKETIISPNLKYHLDRNLTLEECIFRHYSPAYFSLIEEIRKLYNEDLIELNGYDADIVESDLGKTAIYEGREVFLDAPIEENLDEELINEAKHHGKNVKLNKPFRTPGGPKKFAVYVKSKAGKIKKVTFGDPKMKIKASSKARRKSFSARHNCGQKKDRTTAGYWSCRSHRIKSLGTKSKGKYW